MANVGIWLFTENPFPTGGGNDDNVDYTLGTIFTTGTNRDIDGIAFYVSEADGDPTIDRTIALYTNGNSTAITTASQSGIQQGWNLVQFDVPVAIVTSTQYVAAYTVPGAELSNRGYFAAGNYHESRTVTLNDMTAIDNNDDDEAIGNGRFLQQTGPDYPTDTFNDSGYFITPYYNDAPVYPPFPRRQNRSVRM